MDLPAATPPEAATRLFCFPHAGGGAATCRDWPDRVGADIEVVGVRLPGRESRFAERRYRRMAAAVTDLCAALRPHLTGRYAFFGHSLGALLGYEAARRLATAGTGPAHLFVAGCAAPHRPGVEGPLRDLPADAFIARLRDYGGMPAEVLAQPDLVRVMLPTIRDDFEIVETYRPGPVGSLRCPVTAWGGDADRTVSVPDLSAWADVTGDRFAMDMFTGDHFFVSDPACDVPERIRAALTTPAVSSPRHLPCRTRPAQLA